MKTRNEIALECAQAAVQSTWGYLKGGSAGTHDTALWFRNNMDLGGPAHCIKQVEALILSAFNRLGEGAKLDELCGLLASAWLNGGWKPETYNEGEMQKILRDRGWWPITETALIERRAALTASKELGESPNGKEKSP